MKFNLSFYLYAYLFGALLMSCVPDEDEVVEPEENYDVYFKIKIGDGAMKTFNINGPFTVSQEDAINAANASYVDSNTDFNLSLADENNWMFGGNLFIRKDGQLNIGSFKVGRNELLFHCVGPPYNNGLLGYYPIDEDSITVTITQIDPQLGGFIKGVFSGNIGYEYGGEWNGDPVINTYASNGEFKVYRNY